MKRYDKCPHCNRTLIKSEYTDYYKCEKCNLYINIEDLILPESQTKLDEFI